VLVTVAPGLSRPELSELDAIDFQIARMVIIKASFAGGAVA